MYSPTWVSECLTVPWSRPPPIAWRRVGLHLPESLMRAPCIPTRRAITWIDRDERRCRDIMRLLVASFQSITGMRIRLLAPARPLYVRSPNILN